MAGSDSDIYSGVYSVCVAGSQVAEAVDVLRGAGISEATDRLMTSGNHNPQSPANAACMAGCNGLERCARQVSE